MRSGAFRYWAAEDFPIRIRIDDAIDHRYIVGLRAAVDRWNYLVGVDFLRVILVDHSQLWAADHCINVRERELGSSQRHKEVWGLNRPWLTSEGRVLRSLVEFDLDLPEHAIFEVALHELGHALGLLHDEGDSDSIMYPYIADYWGQELTMEDVEAIRSYVPIQRLALASNNGEDPFPRQEPPEIPIVYYPVPCPGVGVSRWMALVLDEEDPPAAYGSCVGP